MTSEPACEACRWALMRPEDIEPDAAVGYTFAIGMAQQLVATETATPTRLCEDHRRDFENMVEGLRHRAAARRS